MAIEKLNLTQYPDNIVFKNYIVIEPVWDSFLKELYRSIIIRNNHGINTHKADLSVENNIINYINVLISEFYEIIKLNDNTINTNLFNTTLSNYYFKRGKDIQNFDTLNPVISFNKNLLEIPASYQNFSCIIYIPVIC